jgi:hypothetical protein
MVQKAGKVMDYILEQFWRNRVFIGCREMIAFNRLLKKSGLDAVSRT